MENKQVSVSLCLYCEKEFPEVRTAMEAYLKKYKRGGPVTFSHGYCNRHYIEVLKQYGQTDDEIKASIASAKSKGGESPPDLKERPDLVDAYSKGIFTKEQLQQANQVQQTENNTITERFKKLAGIHS